MDTAFSPRTYAKAEFAQLYLPDSTAKSATRTLNRWIQRCTLLQMELQKMNYNPRRHTLLKNEVEAITRHLGEP